MRIASILTIMDKPKHTQVALRRALELQQLTHARVEAVAFCWQAMATSNDVFDRDERLAIKRQLMSERRTWQQQCVMQANVADAEVFRKTVWSDDIAGWTAAAAPGHYDLVVKSAHYSKTLVHTPLDWRLLRECPVPILLTSTRQRKNADIVLAAVDLTSLDRAHQRLNKAVLDAASDFADLTGATLHCVFVVELSQVLRDLDVVNPRDVRRKAIAKHQAALSDLLEPYAVPKSRIHFPVGKVGQSVQQLARKLGAELLVVGTSAHRFKQSIGLGNSAERVLARAPCDVLAVHPTSASTR